MSSPRRLPSKGLNLAREFKEQGRIGREKITCGWVMPTAGFSLENLADLELTTQVSSQN